jgi:hypothetical protein
MRRLVPMPGPSKGLSKAPSPEPTPPAAPPPAPPPVPPTFRTSWPLFAWLIATAVVMYFAKWQILVIAALIGFFRGLSWLGERYPRTMFVILAIVRGMMGGRRR